MSLYHFSVTQKSRGAGHSVVASAAYISGTKLHDNYYGENPDYTKKSGVLHSEIILPDYVPKRFYDREILWNEVEHVEKHPKAQLAYSFDIALQNELSFEENLSLARQFIQENFISRGMIADMALHEPDVEEGGISNPHFHVLCPIRPINPDGTWGAKQHREYILDESGNRIMEEKLKYVSNPEKLPSMQNTINRYRCDYRRFFEKTDFEGKYIDTITKSDIEGVIYMNLTKFHLRDKGFKGLQLILRTTFNLAYEQCWIQDNVFDRMNFKKFEGMLSDDIDIERRVHSNEDLKRIIDEIHEHQKKKPYYIPAYAFELQILTGTRRGEIPPLRRSDILDMFIVISREQITVKKCGDIPEHCVIVNHTKNRINRRFPRSAALNDFLKRLYWVLDTYYPNSEYLFPADNENGVISNNTVYNYYGRVCRKLGIKISKEEIKGTHSFRRNAITDVVNATGGNLILTSALFGNSPQVAKKNYYTGIDNSEALKALNKRKLS